MKSVFGFRVRLGNPDLDFQNLNPDFPIERTLNFFSSNTEAAQDFRDELDTKEAKSIGWIKEHAL